MPGGRGMGESRMELERRCFGVKKGEEGGSKPWTRQGWQSWPLPYPNPPMGASWTCASYFTDADLSSPIGQDRDQHGIREGNLWPAQFQPRIWHRLGRHMVPALNSTGL